MHIGPLAGIGLTAYKDGSIRSSGVITATTYYGSGANLTGIDATQIQTGNTSVQTVDTGSDGHVKVTTEGTERLRIDTTGRLLLGTQRTHSDQSYYDDITINNSNGSSASGGTGITLISDNASWGALLLGDEDDHDVGGFKYSHGSNYMEVRTNGSEKLRIGSSGEIGVGGGGSIVHYTINEIMKLKISRCKLEEIVRGVVREAAKQGKMQKLYKASYNKMINLARGGGNKNTAPFTKKAAKAGKSGLGPY